MTQPRLTEELIEENRLIVTNNFYPLHAITLDRIGWALVDGAYLCTQEIEDIKRTADAAKAINSIEYVILENVAETIRNETIRDELLKKLLALKEAAQSE